MEHQCGYCEKPLAEIERVRWYDEYIHSECYEALLADVFAIIVTEQPAPDPNQEVTAGFASAGAVHHL
jgi:hypothetical protein